MDIPDGYGVLMAHMGADGWEVNDFPERILVDVWFLKSGAADPNTVEQNGDEVTFRAANGWATYRLREREYEPIYEAERIAGVF